MAVSTDANHLNQRGWLMRFGPLAAVLAALASACSPAPADPGPAAAALLQRIGVEELSTTPETADVVGVSTDLFGGAYHDRLDDRSIAASQRKRMERLVRLRELETAPREGVAAPLRRQLDSATWTYDAVARLDRHGYGNVALGWASPYLMTPADGAYVDIVKLMTLHHPVRNRAEAETWLKRLSGYGRAISDETTRFSIDIKSGAVPPKALLRRVLDRARGLAPVDPRNHRLTLYLVESLSQIPDLPEADIRRLVDRAVETLSTDVTPAYVELLKLLETTLAEAPEEPGVWRLPNGEAYYRDALHLYTGTDLTPAQIHEAGAKMVESLTAQLDEALIALGHEEGSVGERLRALSVDPAYIYPETDEGQIAMREALEAQMSWAERMLPRMVLQRPTRKAELRQAPAIVSDGAPVAYYRAGALDGSRPATYTLNLRASLRTPSWALPTITYHEAIPGHHVQAGGARERWQGSPLALLMSSPAFSEGWGVYAEDLADEFGAYEQDPLGRIGYLQSLLLRAARMTADTGINAEKWSRQQAIDYLTGVTGISVPEAEREVDRYSMWPGQGAAYMIGRETIRRLRESARRELGASFDLRAFHDIVLGDGARPLVTLESDVQAWVAAQRRPAPAPE